MNAKEFLNYNQCLELAKLNYDGDYDFVYHATGELWERGRKDKKERFLPAPLKQQVFRWFREKYDLHHVVIWDSETNNFDAGLFGELVIPFLEEDTIFTTYEEAENACIDKLIELAKQQDNEK